MSESRNLATQPREAESIGHYDLEADVVVVGLGIAGACAALEAVAEGAEVLVLERAGGGRAALLPASCREPLHNKLAVRRAALHIQDAWTGLERVHPREGSRVRKLWLVHLALHWPVRGALAELRGAALLRGVRGRPPADLDAVVAAALGLSTLVAELGDDIAEIDINPLVALPDRAVAVDALIVPTSPAD